MMKLSRQAVQNCGWSLVSVSTTEQFSSETGETVSSVRVETYTKEVANGTILTLQRNPDSIVFLKVLVSDSRTVRAIATEVKLLEAKEMALKLSKK